MPSGLSDVVAIAGGAGHGLALRQNGTVVAWGDHLYSQVNVPKDLSNVVAVAGEGVLSLALKKDGSLVAWGFSTNVPSNLKRAVALAGGGSRFLIMASDNEPVATSITLSSVVNYDLVIPLTCEYANGDPLSIKTFCINTIPASGALCQYSSGDRGAPIVNANTVVSDSLGRVIFVPDSETRPAGFAFFNLASMMGWRIPPLRQRW